MLGSQTALAAAFGKAQGHASHWVKTGCVPAAYGPDIERLTGGLVLCEDLCPGTNWVRTPDPSWPHPEGRPLIDVARQAPAVAEA